MRVGIIGLPRSGKSCLFYLLSGQESVHSPVSAVKYADERLAGLSRLFPGKKIVHSEIIIEDIQAVKEDTPKLIDTVRIKDMDVFIITARAFAAGGSAALPENLRKDVDVLTTAFMVTDLEAVENGLERISRDLAKGKKDRESEAKLLGRVREFLAKELPLSGLSLNPQEEAMLRGYKFLSRKPVVAVINVAEERLKQETDGCAGNANTPADIRACLKAEYEILQLEPPERAPFMRELGLETFCAARVLESCFRAFRRIFFFTVGEKEIKAWPAEQGTTACAAAGKIHSDMQKGFIKAQVIAYDELMRLGGLHQARAAGALRLEGKDYLVRDADVIEFKFGAGRKA